jgi:Holliday junction resolvase RusA-like endonuclease
MTLSFFIPGPPRGKGRPKFSARGGIVRTYTDEQTASYENLVALAAKRAMGDTDPISEACAVYIRAEFEVPKSVSAKKREQMLEGEIEPTKKPDLDNIAKAVLDGLNKVAFVDDVLVTYFLATKIYSKTPGVFVSVTPKSEENP